MTPAAVKRASEQALGDMGVAINPHLPECEPLPALRPRSAAEVACRAFVLSHIIGVGYDRSGREMLSWLEEAELQGQLTPKELALLNSPQFTQGEKAWAAWHASAVHACAWALQLEDMEPLSPCPDSLADRFPPRTNPNRAIQVAVLRPLHDLRLGSDLYYRLHWAAREAHLCGLPFPLPEVEVEMRRKALDWIVGLPYEWDEVPLDT